jgi:hypothetical protein
MPRESGVQLRLLLGRQQRDDLLALIRREVNARQRADEPVGAVMTAGVAGRRRDGLAGGGRRSCGDGRALGAGGKRKRAGCQYGDGDDLGSKHGLLLDEG